ncbi:hypothetical protein STENM327S_00894 [Streptomyces tendae]
MTVEGSGTLAFFGHGGHHVQVPPARRSSWS